MSEKNGGLISKCLQNFFSISYVIDFVFHFENGMIVKN